MRGVRVRPWCGAGDPDQLTRAQPVACLRLLSGARAVGMTGKPVTRARWIARIWRIVHSFRRRPGRWPRSTVTTHEPLSCTIGSWNRNTRPHRSEAARHRSKRRPARGGGHRRKSRFSRVAKECHSDAGVVSPFRRRRRARLTTVLHGDVGRRAGESATTSVPGDRSLLSMEIARLCALGNKGLSPAAPDSWTKDTFLRLIVPAIW